MAGGCPSRWADKGGHQARRRLLQKLSCGGGGHMVAQHVGGSSLLAGEAEQPEEGAGAALSEPYPPGKPIALPLLC